MSNLGWSDASFNYQGCHVLVTGGTGGIGAAVARAYRRSGASVTVTGTRMDATSNPLFAASFAANRREGDTKEVPFRYLQLDVRDPQQVQQVATACPELDIVVNCAGVALSGDGSNEYGVEAFERALDINLSGAFRLAAASRAALSRSEWPGGASMINIASMTSFFGNEIVPGYGAAKAGLVQLVKTLAIAWAGEGVRVNAIAAGLTETAMTAAHVGNPEALAPVLHRTPMRRVGRPDDMAGPILFLTSSLAGFVTGQTLVIDGGYSIVG